VLGNATTQSAAGVGQQAGSNLGIPLGIRSARRPRRSCRPAYMSTSPGIEDRPRGPGRPRQPNRHREPLPCRSRSGLTAGHDQQSLVVGLDQIKPSHRPHIAHLGLSPYHHASPGLRQQGAKPPAPHHSDPTDRGHHAAQLVQICRVPKWVPNSPCLTGPDRTDRTLGRTESRSPDPTGLTGRFSGTLNPQVLGSGTTPGRRPSLSSAGAKVGVPNSAT